MTYVTADATGSFESQEVAPVAQPTQEPERQAFRIVTEGFPVSNTRYTDTQESTDERIRRAIQNPQRPPRKLRSEDVAVREHVSRLLRDCQQISRDLLNSDDPIESALLGGQLTNSLYELWDYRKCREADWIEILNVLQIAVPAEEFEFLSKEKRLALVKIFTEGLVIRTIGPSEVDRSLKILTDAGFDIWRALSDENEHA
jgi:hypothetical protein